MVSPSCLLPTGQRHGTHSPEAGKDERKHPVIRPATARKLTGTGLPFIYKICAPSLKEGTQCLVFLIVDPICLTAGDPINYFMPFWISSTVSLVIRVKPRNTF